MSTRSDDEPVVLNIGADTFGHTISMTRGFDTESDSLEPVLPEPKTGASTADLAAGRGERTSAEDLTTEELREVIDDLNDDEVVDLVALAWVGRDDFRRGEREQTSYLTRERHRVLIFVEKCPGFFSLRSDPLGGYVSLVWAWVEARFSPFVF